MVSIFHITTLGESNAYRSRGAIVPDSLASEGFVHCSYLEQLPWVLGTFFRGRTDVVVLELDARKCPLTLVEEAPGTDELFPHVYGEISMSAVVGERRFHPDEDGRFALDEAELALLHRAEERDRELGVAFAWYSHPEGMRFVETARNAERTLGHFWFVRGARSVFHRVMNGDEIWLIHEGGLLLHVIEHGVLVTHRLGLEVAAGEKLSVTVPRGALQAAELAPWHHLALGSNLCAPAFDFAALQLPTRHDLLLAHPAQERTIRRLTHAP